jgi:hypothetical protein
VFFSKRTIWCWPLRSLGNVKISQTPHLAYKMIPPTQKPTTSTCAYQLHERGALQNKYYLYCLGYRLWYTYYNLILKINIILLPTWHAPWGALDPIGHLHLLINHMRKTLCKANSICAVCDIDFDIHTTYITLQFFI